MATVQTRKGKKGTTYRVEFMRNGVRKSQSFKLKKEAQKFCATILVDNDLVNLLTDRTLTTLKFSDAVNQYLNEDIGRDPSKRQRLTQWVSWVSDKPIGSVTRKEIRAKLKELSATKAPATLNRYKAAIGSLYRYLGEEHDIDYNPVKGIRQFTEDNARTRYLSKQELPRLLAAVKESGWQRLYLLVLMAITTGARRSELLTLTWERVDLKSKTACLVTSKNGEQRTLTFTAEVVAELMKHRQVKGFVFPKPDDNSRYFRNFDCYWKQALKTASVENFRFHDLRHTCASLLAMNGAHLIEIADVLGHKSITMTQRYSHLCVEHKANLTDKVFGTIANG